MKPNCKFIGKAGLLSLLLFSLYLSSFSQCLLRPISLAERVNNAVLIAEGRITSATPVWDDPHKNIYTVYTVEATKIFKGSTGASFKVLAKGGTLGLTRTEVSNQLNLAPRQNILFTLIPSTQAVGGSSLYECYAGLQGAIIYDEATQRGEGVFDSYPSLENDLYNKVTSLTGHSFSQVGTLQFNAPSSGFTQSTITSFSPASLNAGNDEILTITGTGFGSTQGTSYVQFKNADNGGSGYMSPQSGEYVSWTDTQIKVYVPGGAGTGTIRVVTASTVTSSTSLLINYNLKRVTYNNGSYLAPLVNQNGSGGMTYTFYSAFSGTSAATYFQKALVDWNCNSNVNFRLSASTTATSPTGNDGVNLVRFETSSTELSAGVLGSTTTTSSGCSVNGVISWYVADIDMVYDGETSWYYGTGTPGASQYDFYSMILHEIGHAHGLGHAINSGTMMHYSLTNGTAVRTFNASQETAGAARMMAVSTTTSNCGESVMSSFSACSTPSVTLSVGTTTISENGGSTTLTATLSNIYVLPVTVSISTTGTATSGTDYSLSSTTITVPAGSTSASVTLTGTDDAVFEGSETVIMDISSVTNGTENGTQQKTVTITDDETGPTVTLSTSSSSFSEAGTSVDVTVTLSGTSSLATTVVLATSGTATYGTDYNLTTSLVIAAGTLSKTTTMTVIDDVYYEPAETVIMDISSVTNGTENGTQQKTVNLVSDDGPPTVTLTTGVASIAENSSTTVTATLNNISGYTTTVNLALSGTATSGSDYTLNTSISIPAGSISGAITLSPVDDVLDEDDETVTIDISSVTNGTESGTQQKTVTITDNDASPTVTLAWSTSSLNELTGLTSTLTATLSALSGRTVTVNLTYGGTATSGTDYSGTASTILITAGNISANTTLSVISDLLYEGNETVIPTISSVTNGSAGSPSSATLTINDDDAIPTVSLSSNASGISENGGVATLTATLSAVSGVTTTVNLSVSGTAVSGTDYTLSGTSISISPGSLTGTRTITGINDAISEGDETVIVDISSVTNATENGTQQTTVTIADDETLPVVTLSTTATLVGEIGGTATITATLSKTSANPTYVYLTTSGTATYAVDYSLTGTTITIAAGSTSGSITFNTIDDPLYELTEYGIIDISSVTNGTESGAQQVSVGISSFDPAPSVTMSSGAAAMVENGGSAQLTFTLSAVSGENTTINLSTSGTATAGTDYTISTTSLVIPAGSTSGTVTLTAINDAITEGAETIIIDISTVTNGTESGIQQLTVTITDAAVVAVKFVSFKAKERDCAILLDFTAVEDMNTDHYEIQRSIDGTHWKMISALQRISTGSMTNNYSVQDPGALAGRNFYRVVEVSHDGTLTFSDVQSVSRRCGENAVLAYPNPFTESITVENISAGSAIIVTDVAGRQLMSVVAAGTKTVLNMRPLVAGSYFIRVIKDNTVVTIPAVKK